MCNFLFTDGCLVCLEKFKETIIFNVNNMITMLHPYTRGTKEVIYMYTLVSITNLLSVGLLTVQYCTVLYCTVMYRTVQYCTVL